MTLEDASASLRSAALLFKANTKETVAVPSGQVMGQEPEAGASVSEESVVELVVAVAPPVSVYIVATTVPAVAHPVAIAEIKPPDQLLGGGAWADWRGAGSLLKRSAPSGSSDVQAWEASAKDHMVSDPAALTAYALGLRDPGRIWQTKVVKSTSGVLPHPRETATLPAGYALAGGGCRVNVADGAPGNLLTASFPLSQTTWECRAKDHNIPSPASVTAFVIGIRPSNPNAPLPEVWIDSATSSVGANPQVEVRPSKPGFVVTGGGARADIGPNDRVGQLLTRSAPLPPAPGGSAPAGWVARSKDHVAPMQISVTAFVVSVKLEP